MIITVPEYKKIYYNEILENYNKSLNEAKVFDVIKKAAGVVFKKQE